MPQSPEPVTDGTRPGEGENGSAAKRPYLPPRITFREPLEAIAIVCTVPGKAVAGTGGCSFATS